MGQKELKDILSFAKEHNLLKEPFLKVYSLWIKEQEEIFNGWNILKEDNIVNCC